MKIPDSPPSLNKLLKGQSGQFLELMNKDHIQQFVRKANSEYWYWSELKYRQMPAGTTPEQTWAIARILRRSNAKFLVVSKAPNFTFTYNMPDRIQQKLHEFDLDMGGQILGGGYITPEDKERYLINSLMEEAIASSQLEGAATTRKVAKDMLRTARKPKTKSERMILNNYLTINKILEWKGKKLTPSMILEIHASMTQGTLKDAEYEGRFRDANDVDVIDSQTGLVSYHPPDYALLPQLIDDLCAFVNNESKEFMHPLVKASILHFLMGYIHPFVDGNGRTARALFYWYALSKKYWIFEFMPMSRMILKSPAQYARAYLYVEKDDNDLTYFIDYQLHTLDLALKDFSKYVDRKFQEKKELTSMVKTGDVNDRQAIILREFAKDADRVMTIAEAQTTFSVVYQTARNDLLELEEKGYLQKTRKGKKKLLFSRSADFDKRLRELQTGKDFSEKKKPKSGKDLSLRQFIPKR